jgi:hypothetical protein
MWLANHSVVTKEGSLNKGCAEAAAANKNAKAKIPNRLIISHLLSCCSPFVFPQRF